ncbi:MAG: type II secretory pathway protein [uncultured bacterium]|nr:MAG: type II secretory pathway protein [uncultured bacterium]OGT25704.1 MAG: hypothetical protein A3B71_01040 [Gammaproteobacteria bacterium RIFCSPHIGHO2_02_FULL_42_43]OGT51652.1 MAG: hypothetical protein A3E54_03255 [Gammaproteobacteria bacterium RIFCSPHIGHO2_12_FULL_41_25]OGT61550.1 MAG: hypothetical protein A3I77_03060 [Gammaproteobacteria bacterium RIFCSPLOWO2_02_FULL_42_14]OGT86173.1 MAG: hypothetical protein A3G86_05910 [Gammaproteobacteria bacterium RIFCSPLOWO2_12_FULL_42_18]
MFLKKNHNASALVSALFITALAAVLAIAIMVAQHILIHESSVVIATDQLYLDLQSMQQAEMASVTRYANKEKLQTQFPHVLLGDTTLTGTIENEQGKFNLNDLVYPANQPRFVILLQTVLPTLPHAQCQQIAEAITAWLTGDSKQNSYYFSLHPPYRPAGQLMVNTSELRLVANVNAEIYNALAPYITALPVQLPAVTPGDKKSTQQAVQSPIDVNGVSAPVLLTVNPSLSLAQAETVIRCRDQFGGFTSMDTFETDCEAPFQISGLSGLKTRSQYFLGVAYAKTGDDVARLKSLLVTAPQKDNTLKAVLVWQSFE